MVWYSLLPAWSSTQNNLRLLFVRKPSLCVTSPRIWGYWPNNNTRSLPLPMLGLIKRNRSILFYVGINLSLLASGDKKITKLRPNFRPSTWDSFQSSNKTIPKATLKCKIQTTEIKSVGFEPLALSTESWLLNFPTLPLWLPQVKSSLCIDSIENMFTKTWNCTFRAR